MGRLYVIIFILLGFYLADSLGVLQNLSLRPILVQDKPLTVNSTYSSYTSR